jgi:hypothetical protein
MISALTKCNDDKKLFIDYRVRRDSSRTYTRTVHIGGINNRTDNTKHLLKLAQWSQY